ncbi:MAG: stage sporulation protein [Chloroflexi bacterium]|nr:stage sporulation protein [Chloroflexota bacterium]
MVVARGRIDTILLLPVVVLLAIGAGMVFSASFVVAHNEFGDDTYFLVRHLLWITIGMGVLVVVSHMDYHRWQRLAVPFYAVSLALLLLVLIPGIGSSAYGASRWFTVGSILSIQPSEIAKLAVVVYLGAWVTRVGTDINKFTFGTVPFAIILGLSAGLVLVEPDLGTTVVLVLTAGSVFFISGANVLHALVGLMVIAVAGVKVIASSAYKSDRIDAFVNPWADPNGVGWHTTQSLLALGSGGLTGLGLGASRQKYYYVPNAHTDSIFAIVGEEIGFLGTTLVLVLFLIIVWRGLTIAGASRDPLGRALAAGATLMLAWQAMLNMAVVSHVVPNTGVPLPFVSYGGNAMVVSMAAVGIILSVGRSLSPSVLSWRSWLPQLGRIGSRADRATPTTSARPARDTRPTARGRTVPVTGRAALAQVRGSVRPRTRRRPLPSR